MMKNNVLAAKKTKRGGGLPPPKRIRAIKPAHKPLKIHPPILLVAIGSDRCRFTFTQLPLFRIRRPGVAECRYNEDFARR